MPLIRVILAKIHNHVYVFSSTMIQGLNVYAFNRWHRPTSFRGYDVMIVSLYNNYYVFHDMILMHDL